MDGKHYLLQEQNIPNLAFSQKNFLWKEFRQRGPDAVYNPTKEIHREAEFHQVRHLYSAVVSMG